ncbi:restriction endonuclease subunit S [Lacinutrix mariniflava]|uniref:restriction endonuclease subunit S n=1 Tax=Lacinutrix mariniflava TaxID=342955 RepID=UPI0009F8F672|nr:restriction endonuclease subunit S [Lacinutrix mariniflava]
MMKETAVEKNMKRYESYKDSGVEWLGEIPEHWEVRPGFTILTESKKKNTGFIEDTVLSLSYGNVIVKPKEKLTGLVPESFETYQLVEPGDIIIRPTDLQNDKTSLRTGLAKNEGIITSAYINLRVNKKNDNSFYHYYLYTIDINKVIYGLGSGLRQNISFEDFKRFPFPLPPITEQTKIAQFLDDKTTKIDEAIAIKQQQIQLLKERKQILIHKAVTQGLNPNVTLKDSGMEWIGEIPVGWEVKRLKHCLNINNGSDYKHIQTDEGYPVIGSGGQFAYASDYMYDGEVVLLGRKGTIDKPLYFKGKFWAVDTMFYANAKNGNIVKFLYYLATTLPFSFYSTATALPSMTQGDLNNHPISRPPIDEQNKIVEYIENGTQKIETAISLKQQEIEKLKEYKSSLINGVVTGKVKVC